jgi:hypothetical protein
VEQVIRHFRDATFGFWVALPLLVFGFVANLLKLIINLSYLYAHPDVAPVGVDPVTGFVVGLGVIWVAGYLMKGLRERSIWAAIGLAVAMPLLYVLMVEGIVAALVHEQNYFAGHGNESLCIEVLPASAMVIVFGIQALMNYHQRFRRVGSR